jgi:dipeptidyl aminopeptidase/acylaminoacyl peptidase
MDFLLADPVTGKSRVLLTEAQRTFIKGIAYPGWGDLVTLLPKTKRFIALSERDGWDHLYLYDWQGQLIRRLTVGRWPVLNVAAVDEDGGWVYFTGHDDPRRPYDTHLYRVGLDGQGFKRLTEAAGRHFAQFAPSGKYYLDTHSAVDRPPAVELHAADGRLLQTLSKADISLLHAFGWKAPEPFRVKAADDTTDLEGVIFKPFDFDSSRKYPVLVQLYGGPQLVMTPHGFPATPDDARSIALAQLGFVVVTVDPRGTTERGKAFQDWVYKNWGRYVIPDHVAALKQLGATRPFMDLTRVGVFGVSWGGYHTLRAMVQAPETFHVGVAAAPVADLDDHMARAIEPYMGLPAENRQAYDYASNLLLANRLKGRLLMIHGTSDVNASFSATMKMANALIEAGKPYDLLVVPEMNHGPGPTRSDYFENAVKRYFVEHLRPDPEPGR